MKYICPKHGEVEFSEPNSTQDSFCTHCLRDEPNCKPPHPKMKILEFKRDQKLFIWGSQERV
jgi:hypothetical protein